MSKRTARERAKRLPSRPLIERLPAPLRPWYQAARPRSLPATYAALLTGGAVALEAGVFEPVRFLLALVGALLLQIASNFVNEYVDFQRGTDALKVAGMGMVLSEGKLSAQQVLIGAVVTTIGGALIGLLLVALSGTTLLFIGMIGVAAVVLYTAGPLPLSHIGLGRGDGVPVLRSADDVRDVLRGQRAGERTGVADRRAARLHGRRDFARQQHARYRGGSRGEQAHVSSALWLARRVHRVQHLGLRSVCLARRADLGRRPAADDGYRVRDALGSGLVGARHHAQQGRASLASRARADGALALVAGLGVEFWMALGGAAERLKDDDTI
jgi:hypothetical protein